MVKAHMPSVGSCHWSSTRCTWNSPRLVVIHTRWWQLEFKWQLGFFSFVLTCDCPWMSVMQDLQLWQLNSLGTSDASCYDNNWTSKQMMKSSLLTAEWRFYFGFFVWTLAFFKLSQGSYGKTLCTDKWKGQSSLQFHWLNISYRQMNKPSTSNKIMQHLTGKERSLQKQQEQGFLEDFVFRGGGGVSAVWGGEWKMQVQWASVKKKFLAFFWSGQFFWGGISPPPLKWPPGNPEEHYLNLQ